MSQNLLGQHHSITLASVNLLWVSSRLTSGSFSLVDGSREFGIIEIVTEDGRVGYSEVYLSLYADFESIQRIIRSLASQLNTTSFQNPSEIFSALRVPFLVRAGAYFNLACAIEMAAWDAWFKGINRPHWASFNNDDENLLIYGSGGSNLMSPEQVCEEFLWSVGSFDGYKFRIGLRQSSIDLKKIDLISLNATSNSVWMIDAIAETRREIWSFSDASILISNCIERGALWYEEPFRVDRFEDYQKIMTSFPRFIAMGEALSSELEVISMSSEAGLGWLQLDVTHNTTFSLLDNLLQQRRGSHPKLALHCWGSMLAFRQTYFARLLFPKIEWIERPLIGYEIDHFFPEPSITDSSIIPTDNMTEMIRWFDGRNQLKRFDVKIND
jgi:L-alanine-DL-glutamate epimerase-like enolase superfamily enzyme